MPFSPLIPPKPLDHWSFISLLADILRLPEETVILTHLYINTYLYYCPYLISSAGHRRIQEQQHLGTESRGSNSQNYQLESDYGTGPGSSSSVLSTSSESASSAYGVKLATERENDDTREGEIDGIRACEGVTASKKVLPLPLTKHGNSDKKSVADNTIDQAGDVQMDQGGDDVGQESGIGGRNTAYDTRPPSANAATGNSFDRHSLITGLDIYVSLAICNFVAVRFFFNCHIPIFNTVLFGKERNENNRNLIDAT